MFVSVLQIFSENQKDIKNYLKVIELILEARCFNVVDNFGEKKITS